MGYSWEDAEREMAEERFIAEVLDDHRDIIVAEFVEERLASYFEEHPDLCAPAQQAHVEAKALLPVSLSASLVFALSAVEIAIRDVLLRPIVAGLTHNPNLSDVMAELIDIRSRKTEKILLYVMDEIGLPSFSEQRLANGLVVQSEKKELQEVRNKVLHRGEAATKGQTERSLELSAYFVDTLYPIVREHFTHRSTGWV